MEPSKWIVILTGITLVFAILVLLTFIIKVQGKIFTGIDRKKAAAAAEAKAQPAPDSDACDRLLRAWQAPRWACPRCTWASSLVSEGRSGCRAWWAWHRPPA